MYLQEAKRRGNLKLKRAGFNPIRYAQGQVPWNPAYEKVENGSG